jgi:Fe-S cluster assembly protein SufD
MGNLSKISQAFIKKNNAADFTCSEPWLEKLRKSGLENFSVNGLPTPKIEEWKYTSLKMLDNIDNGINSTLNIQQVEIDWLPADLETHKLVFVNGHFDKALSAIGPLGKGVTVLPLSEVLAAEPALIEGYLGKIGSVEDLPVFALNTAFIEDGLVVLIDNAVLNKPIELLYVSQSS